MSVFELDIAWAATANERRYLHWELLACEAVRGVFLTSREDVLAVLFSGNRQAFRDWVRSLSPPSLRLALDHNDNDKRRGFE